MKYCHWPISAVHSFSCESVFLELGYEEKRCILQQELFETGLMPLKCYSMCFCILYGKLKM